MRGGIARKRAPTEEEEVSAENLVDSEGLEPTTPWFEAKCSIQLSYESKFSLCEMEACGEPGAGRARMRNFREKEVRVNGWPDLGN